MTTTLGRVAVFSGCALLALAGIGWAATAEKTPAERLTALEESLGFKSFTRGEKGGFLILRDVAGKQLTYVGSSSTGRGRVTLNDPTTDQEVTKLVVNDRGGALVISDSAGEAKAETAVGTAGGGYAQFSNSEGKVVTYLGTSTSGASVHTLNRADGTLAVRLGASEGGHGYLEGFNLGGKKVVHAGSTTEGQGIFAVYNTDGVQQATLSATATSGKLWTNGNDYAEVFELADPRAVRPGDVLCIDPDRPGGLAHCRAEGDPSVAGVVSGAGGLAQGMVIGQRRDRSTDHPVALAGQVLVWADASCGPIRPGRPLVASGKTGNACVGDAPQPGTVLGKAMEPLDEGQALIRMLVAPR